MASASIPLLMDDDTIAFGEEENFSPDKLKHPHVTIFHLAFKTAALLIYLLANVLSMSFISSFVIIVLLLSLDFWTVKNITGRMMVGLRWWNYVDDNGVSHWVYESRKLNKVHPSESRIFWLALILSPTLWCFFFFFSLLGFNAKWLVLLAIAIVLSGSNLYGYLKCKMGKEQNLSTATSDFLKKQVMQNVMSSMMNKNPAPTNPNTGTNVI
ncbi:hypothetical protein HCN44_008310 [Aphidius gifuensis]|uniref:Golgi apparatus membrane protein TVP23 homolog n=1 Tax=Aphidius gifuensis TaxID=684658 RepID=A0A834XMT9_APHGI|nr:uncharacterized Golgi apparatus membrane protein-like protein CG5021 isoform X2 [Aphidius gifuensis]KAF7989636.1 hypothetical protein HCN44_008310 [Aphidius gifuensis]